MMMERCIVFVALAITMAARAKGNCGGLLQGPAGKFQSLDKAQLVSVTNGSNYECKWRISLQSGIVKLEFKNFSVGLEQNEEKCDAMNSLTVIENVSLSVKKETLLCGSRLPPTYYSESSNIDVVLKGFIHNQTSSISSFIATYSSVFATKKPDPPCGPCGGNFNQESGMIRSPNFPNSYPNNCDCTWTIYVRREYVVKLKFWSFSLEKDDKTKLCNDYLVVYDGTSTTSHSLGKFCGNQSPGSLQTTKTNAMVHFHSDSSKTGDGFEIMFQSIKDEKDLSSLRSIAAILGGVSFGIFIFLLLCSVIYKKYISNDNQRDTCPSQNTGENDYLDAVQAAAPPSYQAVMADPEHYPRTPEITPSASPNVTPSLMRRSMVRSTPFIHDTSHHLESLEEDENNGNGNGTPPPPYPGTVPETSDDDVLISDLPPPPTYEMVSDSEEHSDSPATWDPTDHDEAHSMTPEVRLILHGNTLASSCTGDGCCNSEGHISLDDHNGCVVPTFQRSRDASGQRTSQRRGISRPKSDGALRDRLLRTVSNEEAHEGLLWNLRRRKLSDDFSVNYHNCHRKDEASNDSQRKRLRDTQSHSTSLFRQRTIENNDLGQQSEPNSPRTHSRSLFSRHNHFANRIQPDSPLADDISSGINSPRVIDSRHNNNQQHRHTFSDSPESSSV